jgi:intergrase/recombinase
MNIFFISENPRLAAHAMTNKHVVKMILESAQMLSSAHRLLDNNNDDRLYKLTHQNHPSSIWARSSKQNYDWLYTHFLALCSEYILRYKKIHKTHRNLSSILYHAPKNIKNLGLTNYAIAITDKSHLVKNEPILSYRKYYESEKLKLDVDKNRYYKIIYGKEVS